VTPAPDVIGLEEVRDFKHASLAIQPLSGFKVDVCSNFPAREGQQEAQQIAIASRLRPISAWAEAWKPGGVIMPPRGFAFAAYQLSQGRVLLVYALHLKSNRGEIHEDMRIREESMRQLLVHMKAMNDTYGKLGALTWIVGGDFNTAPDEPRFAGERTVPGLLGNGFGWAWQGIPLSSRVTIPGDLRYPAACFDQIFSRGATVTRAWVANTSPQSSDHRAVNVVLQVR
jgi:endonuclease/exonuclease/phosphatase family metal-dependent hydrolase